MSTQITRTISPRLTASPLRSRSSSPSPILSRSHSHFFGGSSLNRLSWLRQQQPFLNQIIPSPETQWVVFHGGRPLFQTEPNAKTPVLARLTTADVRPLLGPEPFFGQGQVDGELGASGVVALEGARLRGPPIAFLGLQERTSNERRALPSTDFTPKSDVGLTGVLENIEGSAFFSLDVTGVEQDELDAALQKTSAKKRGAELSFVDPRAAMASLTHSDSNIFAMARSVHDWNSRNKFCPSCGSASYSQWAGWKLTCSSFLPWAPKLEGGKGTCSTAQGLHNFCHPRTDMVVISATVDPKREKMLLGRNKRFPPKFYSVISGFIEPGESLEDAVRREMWEETGVEVLSVHYHSSQPWPYPATLMAGLYAVADSSKPTRTDLDNELEDVRWYDKAEILTALKQHGAVQYDAAAHNLHDAPLRFPDTNAIGGVLISEWAYGRAGPVAKE